MHTFGIAVDKSWLVVNDLLQTDETDHFESIARACIGGQIDWASFDRQFLFAVDDLVTSFRLALNRKPRWKRLGNLARNVEQLRRGAALELKFDLAQWHRASTGINGAAVHGQRNRERTINNGIDRAPYARLEQGPELPTKFVGYERFECGAFGQTQIWLVPPRSRFPIRRVQ